MNNIINQTEKDRIDQLCEEYKITNYTINGDGSIDVNGNVYLHYRALKELPLRFGKVRGDFNCTANAITSLVGCPTNVGGSFYCQDNNITSLEGCPTEVGGCFHCHYNELTSLVHFPSTVGASFSFGENKLPDGFGKLFSRLNQDDGDDDWSTWVDIYDTRYDATYDVYLYISNEEKIFIKYQSYFGIWLPKFNEDNMEMLISEIKDGLE
jgi:hypothetical protein